MCVTGSTADSKSASPGSTPGGGDHERDDSSNRTSWFTKREPFGGEDDPCVLYAFGFRLRFIDLAAFLFHLYLAQV